MMMMMMMMIIVLDGWNVVSKTVCGVLCCDSGKSPNKY